MGLFRKRETYNEQMLREAGLLDWQQEKPLGPPPSTLATLGIPDGTAVGPGDWDTCVTVTAPGLPGERIEFTALPGGDLLVDEEEGSGDLSPLADAVEEGVEPPYKAVAARQRDDLWAVAAKRIEVVHIPFDRGDSLDLSRKDSWEELRVDGEPSNAAPPHELEQLGAVTGTDFYVKAERLEGDLWEVRVSPL